MKKTIITLLILTLFVFTTFAQSTYYVSTTGTINATGTELDPFSMEYLELANDHSDDTFLVKNGEYNKNWKIQVFGTAGHPVKIKAENWRQAKIIGGVNKYDNKRSVVKLSGEYCWFMDFEIYDNNQKRIWINWSDDILMSTGCEIFAQGSKFINNVIHDLIEGIECWSTASGSLIRDEAAEAHFNIIYNIGLDFSDDPRPQSGHGHAIYAQNLEGNALPKYFTANSIWGNFAEGIHFYTEGGNIQNLKALDNTIFNMIGYAIDKIKSRATIIGSLTKTFDDLEYSNNTIFEEAVSIGYGNPWQKTVKVNDNGFFMESSFSMRRFYWTGTEVKRNIMYTPSGTLFNYSVGSNGVSDLNLLNMHDNLMYNTSSQYITSIGVQPETGGTNYIPESGWGTNSINNTVSTSLPPLYVKVTQNIYDNDFAKVVIVNYNATNTVSVTSLPFNNGDVLEIYDTQNMPAPPTTITYNGSSYSFPMTNTAFAALYQNDVDVSHASHTDSRFAEFLIRRVSGTSQPSPDPIFAKSDVGTDYTVGSAGEVVNSVFADNGNGIDLVNNVAASLVNVNLTLVSSDATGLTLDLLDGSVDIDNSLSSGSYTLTYKICQKTDPTNCDNGTVTFNMTTAPPIGQSVTSFTLYDGLQNIVSGFQTIQDNAVINLQSVPATLNIRANTSPTIVGSVYFQLDAAFNGENVAPYDWFGNGSGSFSVGSHTITATPYTEAGQGGSIGTPLTINFTVIDGATNPIIAVNDHFTADTNGGNVGDLTENDLLNNIIVDDNLISATLIDDGGSGSLIKANYILEVPANINAGTYNLTYQICEIADPSNCNTADVVLVITQPVLGKQQVDDFQTNFSIYSDNSSGEYSVEFPIDTPVKNIFIHTSQGVTTMFKNYSSQEDKKVYELTGVVVGSYYMVIYFDNYYIGKYITLE